jgi:hypothetical protein
MRWPRSRKWSPGWWVTSSGGAGGTNQSFASGPIASLPAVVPGAGSIYRCTDAPYEFWSSGGAWVPYAADFQCVQPALASFTQAKVDQSTFDSTHGGIIQTVPTQGNHDDVQYIAQAIPGSGTYFVDVGFRFLTGQPSGGVGMGLTDGVTGTDKLWFQYFGYGTGGIWGYNLAQFTNSTTFSSQGSAWADVIVAPMLFMRLRDDRTNITWYTSPNGYTWDQRAQVARAGFLTPADCGLFVNPYGTQSIIHWLHFSIHT